MIDATPLLRAYASWRRAKLAAEDAASVQQRTLLALVRRAAGTAFGKAHGFSAIASIEAFQARVPLRNYEAFWHEWWQPKFPHLEDVTWPGVIPYFANSSGTTTGASKMIPVSKAMLRANIKAAADVLVHHIAHRPRSRILAGRSFLVGGSSDLKRQAPGIYSGDLSGIAALRTPPWARWLTFPPADIALINDWDAKVSACIERMDRTSIRCITGTPSWLQVIFDRHADALGVEPTARALYPNLELIVHGAVNFAPYRARFEAFLAGSHAELREVYPASEGFIAIADETPADGLRLILDNGLFYEFVPVEELDAPSPRRFWIGNVETGVNYAIIVSCNAGLWSYVLGDTVRFVSLKPPRLLITGRTSYMLSAYGEHLIEEEVEDAISGAARQVGANVNDFTLGARHAEQRGELSGHLFIVEFAAGIDAERQATFIRLVDERLAALNDDYRAHRAEGFALAAPKLRVVPPGFFADWMKSRGRLGGQNKVPRMISDEALFAEVRRFADDYRT
ncbi:MAG: GH3 auxin-responsive promoter family protein [Alphaproteobacteria bacterium]